MELEGPLLRVPFEQLKAAARMRSRLVAELAEVTTTQPQAAASASPREAQATWLMEVEQRLTTLKRKVRGRRLLSLVPGAPP